VQLVAGVWLAVAWALTPAAEEPASDFERLAVAAHQARESGKLEEAAARYREALSLRPEWAEGWWYLGTLHYDREQYAEAAASFRRAAELNPKAGRAFAMLGLSEFKLGRHTDALMHLQHGRRLGLGTESGLRHVVLYTAGLLLLERGEFAQAQRILDELSRDGVEDEDLTIALGLAVLGILPNELRPPQLELVRRAGTVQRLAADRSRIKQALEGYRQLAADYPRVRNVQFALGRFLLANHYDDEALVAFNRELENHPNHLLARLGIAAILARTDPARGLPYAEEAVRMAPRLPEGRYLLGLLRLETGNVASAIEELETAARLAPTDPRIQFALARAYRRAGRKEDAARAATAFQQLSQQDAAEP
jgi:tetratricopeptide (TPR) repeat protein